MKREQRLRKNNDFRDLYRDGVKVRLRGLVVYCRPFASQAYRMGIVASRKIGSAVVRNRFKRRMRTFFGCVKTFPVPCDVVWIATHPSSAQWSFEELHVRVSDGFEQLRKVLEGELRRRAVLKAIPGRALRFDK